MAGFCCWYNPGMIQGADEVIYSRRKRLAISVLAGGRVIVRAPLRTPSAAISAFLREQAGWIAAAQEKMRKVAAPPPAYRFTEGEGILYLGREYPLRLLSQVRGGLRFEGGTGFALEKGRVKEGAALLARFYRQETRRMVTDLAAKYAPSQLPAPRAIRITSAKTRWGSCSARGGLNFSYRLAMVPPAALEYVVVHELAHISHHNHSRVYWELVGQILPGYQKQRAWLRKNGLSLPPV